MVKSLFNTGYLIITLNVTFVTCPCGSTDKKFDN